MEGGLHTTFGTQKYMPQHVRQCCRRRLDGGSILAHGLPWTYADLHSSICCCHAGTRPGLFFPGDRWVSLARTQPNAGARVAASSWDGLQSAMAPYGVALARTRSSELQARRRSSGQVGPGSQRIAASSSSSLSSLQQLMLHRVVCTDAEFSSCEPCQRPGSCSLQGRTPRPGGPTECTM